jgi:hypothetical protein
MRNIGKMNYKPKPPTCGPGILSWIGERHFSKGPAAKPGSLFG